MTHCQCKTCKYDGGNHCTANYGYICDSECWDCEGIKMCEDWEVKDGNT